MGKKKTKKNRGSRSHGRGIKGGRGAGERGGRGKAGLQKHKWKSIVKEDKDYFGPKGFSRPQSVVEEKEPINIYQVEQQIDDLIENGFAKKKGSGYEVDLVKAGYDKLLGQGKTRFQMNIKVPSTSERAVRKIEEAGGKVIKVEQED
ncbi:MAG: uL15m family ribosomal protein [Candidatus Saliniplasma sp.]